MIGLINQEAKMRATLLAGIAAAASAIMIASSSGAAISADIAVEPEMAPESTWYFSLQGGIKFDEEWDDDPEIFIGDFTLHTDNGFRVGAALGYNFSSILVLEGEIGYMTQDFDTLSEDCCDAEFEADGDLSILTGMVNIAAGFTIASFVRPYVGVGAGIAHISFNDVTSTFGFDLDDTDNVFAVQGFAGVDLTLSDRFAIGARYRLLHLSDVSLENNGGFEHDLDPDLIHSLEAVLTVGF